MKRLALLLIPVSAVGLLAVTLLSEKNISDIYGLERGDPRITSVSKLAFGPDGILFIGDSKSATIIALNTGDVERRMESQEIQLESFDEFLASSIGTTVDNITIQDMAVNPISKYPYFAIHKADGSPALLRLVGEKLQGIDLEDIDFSKVELVDPIAEDAKDRRGRELRIWAVSDLSFYKGRVLVSGLSNQEFGSTFRSIPFPFSGSQDYASLEIWHAAHGQFETHAPIKTFTGANIGGKDYLVASYTCTPFVLFPMELLKDRKHVKGRTIGEFGSGNSPLDIISMEKDGKSYFLMSNSSRPLMKVKVDDIERFQESLSETVNEFGATAGVDFVSLSVPYVLQLDKLDDTKFLLLQRQSDGRLNLRTATTRWL